MSKGVAYHALVGWGNVEWPEYVRVYHAADTSCRNHLPAYKNYIQERTCKDSSTYCDIWQCSECGIQFDNPVYFPTLWDGSKVASPRFCPGCGAKVEGDQRV